MTFTFIKPLVERVLRDPETKWSVQGFGMMRTYFGPKDNSKEYRLNLWDGSLRVPDVSTIHDHPWHFESVIVNGLFYNTRYMISERPPGDMRTPTHSFSTIKTGIGGDNSATVSKPEHCILMRGPTETYAPGTRYDQFADEIHESAYINGTVTLNKRRPVKGGEHARVFWPYGTDWVDAAPRDATREELADILGRTLKNWY